ncbi:MAG: DUF2029 domain-containing protein [candidate division Zixibacteria bacterium]|nr:DUF2029 domain-containing protein [candidate division Zixibacteria bacterium]
MTSDPVSAQNSHGSALDRWRQYVTLSSVISSVLLLVAVFLVVALSTHLGDTQWDFTTYYYAGKVSASGGDVYNVDVSRQLAGGYVHQYLYPPMAARLFRPLAALPMDTARQWWFWLHVLALVPLVWIWRRFFIVEGPAWPFYLLAIVGFDQAIYLDLKAGNVTIFEQLLLWTGFTLLVRKRTALFCLCVVGAALLKGLPLLFLGLLFVLSVDRKWLYAAGSVVLYGVAQIIDYVFDPAAYAGYVSRALRWDERGPEFNPSTLALLKDLKKAVIGPGFSEGTADIVLWTIYAAIVATVVIVTWRLIRREYANRISGDSYESAMTITVLVATLAFGLIVPRFKIYSFMMVLPAVYFVIRRFGRHIILPMAIILVALTTHPHLPIEQWSVDLFWWYYPILVLALFWAAWVAGTIRSEKTLLQSKLADSSD